MGHDGGIHAGLLPTDSFPNVLVLSAGGFGHVALPNLLKQLYPTPIAMSPDPSTRFEVWFTGSLHAFREQWLAEINEDLKLQGLSPVQTIRAVPSSESWRDR